MADGSLYDLAGRKEETKEKADEEEMYMQMKVVSLDDRKRVKCESCVRDKCPRSDVSSWSDESLWSEWRERARERRERERQRRERERQRRERAREWYERVAVFLCFVCEMYVCEECLPKHRDHDGMKVGREANEGMGEQRGRGRNEGLGKKCKTMGLEAESEREREREKKESDRERIRERLYAKKLWDDVMDENETESEEKFKTNKVSIIDRVDVKHELDQKDCRITGLCGLENKRLVVCDYINSCIKIFKLGSHVIQRYIRFVESERFERFVGFELSLQRYIRFVESERFERFVGFEPRDVTEIVLKQNSTEPNLVSGSSSDISVTDRADPDKQCLIAVTLPRKCQIVFIDLSKQPAKAQKIIQTERRCYSIQFYDDKIFTVCTEDPGYPYSVYIYSTDGDTLNKFDTGIYGSFSVPYLAVVSGRVYITDRYNDKVQCRNVEGKLISEIEIEGSWPEGISVDPDNNVYVCARDHNKVCKLDADLTRYMSVLDQTTDYIEEPNALCYYREKLFISHDWPPSLKNFVTVVRLP